MQKKSGGREVEVKTHEIGIGSFASVMINGERKTVRQQRAEEEGERLRVFFFLRAPLERTQSRVFNNEGTGHNKTARTNEKKTQRQASVMNSCRSVFTLPHASQQIPAH